MMTYREQKLLAVANVFAASCDKPLSAVSRQFVSDSKTLPRLAKCGTITAARYENAISGFDQNWPSDVDWPSDVPRPSVADKAETEAA